VGPRGEKLESTGPFGLFSYSHPSGKSICHFQGDYALVGDAIREVVWRLFTYGGCNKGGSSISPAMQQSYVLGNPRATEQRERLPYVTSSEMLDGFRSSSTGFYFIPSSIPLFIYSYSAFLWMNSAHRVTVCSLLLLRQWELSRKFWGGYELIPSTHQGE
jgi:hypothetical protein